MPMLLSDLTFLKGQTEIPLRIVGWQPLTRPEQQRACAVQLQAGWNFEQLPTVEKFHFVHARSISHEIWKAFDEGRALFPPDAAAELSQRAQRISDFTSQQINIAWARLSAWTKTNYSDEQRLHIQLQAGIKKSHAPVLSWDNFEDSRTSQQWENQLHEVLNRIRYRLTI